MQWLLFHTIFAQAGRMVKERVKELGGQHFTAYDNNGNAVDVQIAESNARFVNKIGKSVPVNRDLTTKYRNSKIKQEAVVLADELIATARYGEDRAAKYPHGWLDDNGKNDWGEWKTYIQDKENTVWEATLHVSTSTNGEKILYDIYPIKKTGQSGNSDTSTVKPIVAKKTLPVKKRFSIEDVNWVVHNGIITESERSAFYRKIAELTKLGYSYPKLSDGDYVIDVGNKLLFTDGDYDDPKINRVVVLNDTNETNMQAAKEIFSYEDSNLSEFYVKEVYGDGYADVYYAGNYKANARENGRGKGTDSKRYSGKAEKRDDLHSVTEQAREINRLRAQLERAREQTRRTGTYSVNKRKVSKAVRTIFDRYSSDLSGTEAESALTKLYSDMEKSLNRGSVDYDELRGNARQIAEQTAASAEDTSDDASSYLELRRTLRGTEISISDADKADIPDFDGFRKRNFGRLKITKGGTPVDEFYVHLLIEIVLGSGSTSDPTFILEPNCAVRLYRAALFLLVG